MRHALALALALGCSAPLPPDAGPDVPANDVGRDTADSGCVPACAPGAVCWEGVCVTEIPDVVFPDTPREDAVTQDASDAMDAVSDGRVDVGIDAPTDASSDGSTDATPDVPSRLAGAYDLPTIEVAFRQVTSATTPPVRDITTFGNLTRCFYYTANNEVRAYLYYCDSCPLAMMARLATPPNHAAGNPDLLSWETMTDHLYISDTRVERGTPYRSGVMRQNFHVQFRADEASPRPGFSGIPGRTADPAYGDLWLLGCPIEP